jgi:hypothetical protein
MYAAKRSLLEKQNQNVKNEQELWHGTQEKAVVSINLYGFNRSYCESNSGKLYLFLLFKKKQHCSVLIHSYGHCCDVLKLV